MPNRFIKHVAVLGSGVMGSRIACHFANIGCRVTLLDIVPKEHSDSTDKKKRNSIAQHHLNEAIKSNPSPLYRKSFAKRITVGNLEDDLAELRNCDWIIEAVIERLDIKKQVFEKVENYRKPGTIISTNTSGIPIEAMIDGRSDDFKAHFLGTHFFNPPRYLKLLELIPSSKTNREVVDFLNHFGQRVLGKVTVVCKDSPAFIANRVGVFGIMSLFHSVNELGLSVDEIDKLTGPLLGRPKSATFRTADVVGIDTLALVANGLYENAPDDEQHDLFKLPAYLEKMIEKGWTGAKSGQGFYKKVKEGGKSEILSLNLETLEYEAKKRVKFATLDAAKAESNLAKRMPILYGGKDKAGDFYRASFHGLFAYVSNRVPSIADELYKVDDALKAGFGWEMGPFEIWDAVGVKEALEKMDQEVAPWVRDMLAAGHESFYLIKEGKKWYYDLSTKSYVEVPGQRDKLDLDILRESNVVWSNSGTTIVDLGDGILNLEFHTKMNTIGGEVIQGINKAIDLAESEYRGLVISNTGENFSAGANVGMIFMMAVEQEYDELNFAIHSFQQTMMRLRYSGIPVVAAPHGLTLGGGCELCMHADKVVAHAETYIGLVEFGVGLIPGGGGTKEFALRFSDEQKEGDIRVNQLRNRFLTIGQAKVATSAHEGFDLGYLRQGTDEVVVERAYQLTRAKEAALSLANAGYTQQAQRNDIKVLGKEGLGIVYVGANSMEAGNYISEHDALISEKLGTVLCGGDLSEITEVNEQYLLDLERKAFLELCQQRKTLERIQSLITTGKILRN